MSQHESQEPSPRLETLNIVYDEARDAISKQEAILAGLDSKTTVGLGSASVISAGVAIQQAIQSSQDPVSCWWVFLGTASITLGLVAYLVIIFCSIQAYKLRPFKASASAYSLEKKVWPQSPARAKAILTSARLDALATNGKVITGKSKWVSRVHGWLLIEGVALFLLASSLVFGSLGS